MPKYIMNNILVIVLKLDLTFFTNLQFSSDWSFFNTGL